MANDSRKIFFSQNFFSLAYCLSQNLNLHSPFQRIWILVPNEAMKSYLSLQLSLFSPTLGWAGLVFCSLDLFLQKLSEEERLPSSTQLRISLYQSLEKTAPLKKKRLDLSLYLAPFAFQYSREGALEENEHTQLFSSLPSASVFPFHLYQKKELICQDPIHCFGFDFLPKEAWDFLYRQPHSSFYLFSPCHQFWTDIVTPQEQRFFAKDRQRSDTTWEQFSQFFQEAPPLLASLGKLGKQTLRFLDTYPFEIEEAYAPVEEGSLLASIQKGILEFDAKRELKEDDSLRIFQTGACRLKAAEMIADEIVSCVRERSLLFSEIAILAPDIELYAACLMHALEKKKIPYRFPSLMKGKNSSFQLALRLLLDLAKGSWSQETLMLLFENPSFVFFGAHDEEKRKRCLHWIEGVFSCANNWKEGLEKLCFEKITLFAGMPREMLLSTEMEDFEAFCACLETLWQDVGILGQIERTPSQWAEIFLLLQKKYLSSSFSEETESRALSTFQKAIQELSLQEEILCPLALIEEGLIAPFSSSLQANHLHAVRIATLEMGAIFPAKATFLIGMDEEAFPRISPFSPIKRPVDRLDEDRYLFLQVLMNTSLCLRIFYAQISSEDGMEVAPSSVVQEMMQLLGDKIASAITVRMKSFQRKVEIAPCFKIESPPEPLEEKGNLFLSDLVSFSKNPWKHFLQKEHRIFLKDRSPLSMHRERAGVLKSSLYWPIEQVLTSSIDTSFGCYQTAFPLDTQEKARKRDEILRQWGETARPLSFLDTATSEEKPPLTWDAISLKGSVPYTLSEGALHFQDDSLPSLLRMWPEILTVLVGLNKNKIFFLKTGKIKEVQDPFNSLRKFVSYYIRCSKMICPLIPEWADCLLRDKGYEWPDAPFEDVYAEWLYSRLEAPSLSQVREEWSFLKEVFSDLILLYPSRGGSHAPV